MKQAEPIRVVLFGESAISTIPATRVSGAVPRCSQPRSFGLMSAARSATASCRWSIPARIVLFTDWSMRRTYPQVGHGNAPRGERHVNVSVAWTDAVPSTGGLEAGSSQGALSRLRGPDAAADARRRAQA